jgi:hypothetical protein
LAHLKSKDVVVASRTWPFVCTFALLVVFPFAATAGRV